MIELRNLVKNHHTAEYNAQKVVEQLILLQEHYADNRCAECITKHLFTIMAYASEGQHLEGSEEIKKKLVEAYKLAENHFNIMINALREHGKVVDFGKLISEVRKLRKDIVLMLFGIYELEHEHKH